MSGWKNKELKITDPLIQICLGGHSDDKKSAAVKLTALPMRRGEDETKESSAVVGVSSAVVGAAALCIFLNSLHGELIFDDVHAVQRNQARSTIQYQ